MSKTKLGIKNMPLFQELAEEVGKALALAWLQRGKNATPPVPKAEAAHKKASRKRKA
ncbi:MAG: hypothetical protein HY291_11510 [Planctomycetes bacterium]|nr:hypothetical protein [Planctomycetota bacterium]